MVRKRSYKKTVEESDESDSDEFLEETIISASAQTKKYSLRQRRGTNFAEDFDYDVEENEANAGTSGVQVLQSDDEDFDVDVAEQEDTSESSTSKHRSANPRTQSKVINIPQSKCTITKFKGRELEPDIPRDLQSSNDMIDFEDVIRADILVNKSRIDYDSIIEKSEIKLEKSNIPIVEKEETPKKPIKLKKNGEPPKKRGRKPKQKDYDEFPENSSPQPDMTGLPINSVLGVSESLYELAERYQREGGSINDEICEEINPPIIPSIETDSSHCFLENDNIHNLQDTDAVGEAIETF